MGVRVREWKGAWWLYIDHKGKRTLKRMGTGSTGKKAADTAAQMYGAKLALGEDVHTQAKHSPTLAQHAKQWLAHLTGKLGTQEKYAEIMRVHWLPTLGHVPLQQLSRATIKNVLATKASESYARTTIELMVSVLRACLNAAMEDGLLTTNPAASMGQWVGGKPSKRVQAFTRKELAHLLKTALAVMPHHYPLVLLLARTSLRLGEALTLQAGDITIPEACLWVRRTWGSRQAQGEERFNSPKGGKERRVDMSPQLVQAMQQHITQAAPVTWLWPTVVGEPMSAMGFYTDVWRPLMRASGLTYRNPHTLRHTYASLLIAQGASLAYVKEQLGHASIKITVDTYGHLIPGSHKGIVDRLDDVTPASPSR
jgi:integrase